MGPEQHVDPDVSTLTTNSESLLDEASENGLVLESKLNSDSSELENEWSQPRRIAFRIAFVYFLLYAIPFPVGALPGTERLAELYEKVWQALVPWVAHHILKVAYEFSMVDTGSGDRTYDWVRTLCYLAIAIGAAAVWTALDQKRRNYNRMRDWLRFYLRLYVGGIIIGYGAIKVIQAQFPVPNLSRLTQTYGDSSPMGLLWTFMGASHGYNGFTGTIEILGGALLIVPELATLGALTTILAMGNVFILNMAYDVPVKLFSLNLIIMAAFIALPDAQRLASVLVFNRRAEPAKARPWFRRRILNRGLRWVQLVFLILFLGASLFQAWEGSKFWDSVRVDHSIYGIWSVDEFTVDGKLRPLSMSDADRWQRVILEYSNRLSVQLVDAPMQRYSLDLDSKNQTMKLSNREDPKWEASFKYETPKPGFLVFKGEMEGHPVEAKMHLRDPGTFRLTNRGFHWINEYPFNR